MLAAVVADVRAGATAGVIGARFHRAVADVVVDLAGSSGAGRRTIALSGGVFQNALLLRLVMQALRRQGFRGDHAPARSAQ